MEFIAAWYWHAVSEAKGNFSLLFKLTFFWIKEFVFNVSAEKF